VVGRYDLDTLAQRFPDCYPARGSGSGLRCHGPLGLVRWLWRRAARAGAKRGSPPRPPRPAARPARRSSPR
jgi:hypothetical protein